MIRWTGRRCWRLRHEITYPTVIALSIAAGFFRFPFVDQDGRKTRRRRKARSQLRAHDADIKSAAMSTHQ
jgi:hypothetical protein